MSTELFLPQRKTLQDLYVPAEIELPEGDARCQVFNFPTVNPFEVQEQSWVADRPLVVWGFTGSINAAAAPGAAAASGYRVAVYQTHDKVKRAWFNKHQINTNILGAAGNPFLLRPTHLIALGDTITVEVKSLVTPAIGTITKIQVCLFGVQPLEMIAPQLYKGAVTQ